MAYGGRPSDDSSRHGNPSRESAKLYELPPSYCTFVLRLRERAISVGYLLYVFVGLRGFRDLFGKLNRQT